MTTDLARQEPSRWVAPMDAEDAVAALAHVLGTGDLYQLSNEQRVAHYINLCRNIGVSPLSRPYQWIEFKESENTPAVLTLYFKPTAAAQVLRNNHVSVHFPRREIVGELFVVEAHGKTPDGREGVGTKYVPLTGKYGKLTGRHLSNAFMSGETGALRRLALNMGLASGPDTDPFDSAPLHSGQARGAMRTVYVDGTGAILDQPTEEQRHLAEHPQVARAIGEPTYETTAAAMPEALVDLPDQRPRPEEYDPPHSTRFARSGQAAPAPGPRPTLRPTKQDIDRLCGAWFAAVKGSSLDSDDARHQFVGRWTATEQWPEAKQTQSLPVFFARATDREALDLLAHVRALVADEKAANEEALAELALRERSESNGARGSGSVASAEAASLTSQAEEPF